MQIEENQKLRGRNISSPSLLQHSQDKQISDKSFDRESKTPLVDPSQELTINFPKSTNSQLSVSQDTMLHNEENTGLSFDSDAIVDIDSTVASSTDLRNTSNATREFLSPSIGDTSNSVSEMQIDDSLALSPIHYTKTRTQIFQAQTTTNPLLHLTQSQFLSLYRLIPLKSTTFHLRYRQFVQSNLKKQIQWGL